MFAILLMLIPIPKKSYNFVCWTNECGMEFECDNQDLMTMIAEQHSEYHVLDRVVEEV